MKLTKENVLALLLYLCDEMPKQEKRFCELDSVVGDGDHGVTVTRGFTEAKKAISSEPGSPRELLFRMGETMMAAMGGAIGPIYGTLFQGFAEEVPEDGVLTAGDLSRMFQTSLMEIKSVANVTEGQKTLVDALSPAVTSLQDSASKGLSPVEAMALAAESARQGAQATAGMTAQKGRARFLGEKSLGHQDAGASSLAELLRLMAEFFDSRKDASE